MEIANQSSENDAVVQIWAKASSGGVMNSQRFRIVQNANGSYRMLSYASNYTKAVVVKNGSTAEGWGIVQYTDNGSTNGHWYFEPANKTVNTNLNASANSIYNREWAANYAIKYGPSPNPDYEYFGGDGGDCTNFVSQCICAGTLPMRPVEPGWGITDKSNVENWFYINGLLGEYDWISVSFTSATNFNKHWGQPNMRAYQTIEYSSGNEALKDIDFLLWYLKNGDVIQLKKENGTLWHSMIICDDDAICDGAHLNITNSCPNTGKKEIIYAQHSGNYNSGHLRALLKDRADRIVFIKIKKDI